ncbi:MAG: hypothetical protein AAGC97_03595 [Planctomycetota bacterium]
MTLRSVLQTVGNTLQAVHGDKGAIVLTRVGGEPTPTDGIVHRERAEYRRTSSGDREHVWTRRIVLPPGSAGVAIGSTFVVDEQVYCVEHTSRSSASGTLTIKGMRKAVGTVSRDGYYRR